MRKFLSRVHSAYDAPSPADARETRSIFKPRMRRPNFLASVVVNTIRALALIVLILVLSGAFRTAEARWWALPARMWIPPRRWI